jgi:hypothetical protein
MPQSADQELIDDAAYDEAAGALGETMDMAAIEIERHGIRTVIWRRPIPAACAAASLTVPYSATPRPTA